jgi:predicted alpha/beta-fold hydrolase
MMWRLGLVGTGTFFTLPLLDTKIQFYHGETDQTDKWIGACPSLAAGKFIPTPWLANGLLQGYFASTKGCLAGDSPYGKHVDYKRELIVLPDGGTMSIDWATTDQVLPLTNKIALIAHGVTGSSESQYVRNGVQAAIERGYRVGVIQNRGINGTPLTTPKTTHAGMSEDYDFILAQIKRQYPGAPIVGIGCSMGGNLLLKYAGESKENCHLTALVTLSPPYDILKCSRYLAVNLPNRVLPDKYLNNSFRKLLEQNKEMLEPLQQTHGVDIEGALKTTRTWDFDELFTRRVFGFNSPEEYYDTASCRHVLDGIAIPTMSISALDDPVITPDCIPYESFKKNPNTLLVVTRTGGHIGWFQGLHTPQRWYPKPTMEFLDYILAQQ